MDLLQEACLRAWGRRGSFVGGSPAAARTWFSRLLDRTVSELGRGTQALAEPPGPEEAASVEEVTEDRRLRPGPQPDLLSLMEAHERTERLLECLRALPPREAYLVLEVRCGGKKLAEAAAELSLEPRQASALLYAAARRIQEALGLTTEEDRR
jgi:RNA polymerase sigma factor (sigma-70 family)